MKQLGEEHPLISPKRPRAKNGRSIAICAAVLTLIAFGFIRFVPKDILAGGRYEGKRMI